MFAVKRARVQYSRAANIHAVGNRNDSSRHHVPRRATLPSFIAP
jgi:hypothetical protein